MWWNQICVLKVAVVKYNKNYGKGEQPLSHWTCSSPWPVQVCFGGNILIFFIKKQPL